MQIVLPGALPDQPQARELAKHLSSTAPTLAGWLAAGRATVSSVPVATACCTPFEQWQLQERGFVPRPGQALAAGLGPLWQQSPGVDDNTAIWLAELVHISPSRDGAVLLPASSLSINAEHSAALLQDAAKLFEDTVFSVHADTTERWRISAPADFSPAVPSPELVSITSVNDWWKQDEHTRPWRRLFNELQMSWFNHPVNEQRAQQGLAPINGLWLFGGAGSKQLTTADAPQTSVHPALYEYSMKQDWGGWLAALKELEQSVFAPAGKTPPQRLVLTGRDRIVEIVPDRRWWRRFIKPSSDHWSSWW